MSKNFLSNLSIQNVVSANRIHTQKNVSTTKKDRLYWGVSIKINGETKYNCKGEETISNANNIVILPKGANYFWNSSGGECLLIDFDSETTADSIISQRPPRREALLRVAPPSVLPRRRRRK